MGGLSVADLLRGGSDIFGALLGRHSQNKALDAHTAAQREALDFAKQQYAQQLALDQSRYADYQQQRAPYRQTSQDAMQALRRLIGL